VPQFYQMLDIFCLPSIAEGTPLVILEAMASGLPIVASAVGGIPSMISSGVEGYLVPPRSPPQLAKAIVALASSSNLRRQMGARGRLRVEREYSLDHGIERYSSLYKRLT